MLRISPAPWGVGLGVSGAGVGVLVAVGRGVRVSVGASVEVGGTRGTFCIENCVEKLSYFPSPGAEGAADPANLGLGEAGEPVVTNTGITDFGATFPSRIHAFLEDVANGVPKHQLRASGRDALATLEYTWAAIESFEQGGVLVRPVALPPLKRAPGE